MLRLHLRFSNNGYAVSAGSSIPLAARCGAGFGEWTAQSRQFCSDASVNFYAISINRDTVFEKTGDCGRIANPEIAD